MKPQCISRAETHFSIESVWCWFDCQLLQITDISEQLIWLVDISANLIIDIPLTEWASKEV